jgi:hypothetical protein
VINNTIVWVIVKWHKHFLPHKTNMKSWKKSYSPKQKREAKVSLFIFLFILTN